MRCALSVSRFGSRWVNMESDKSHDTKEMDWYYLRNLVRFVFQAHRVLSLASSLFADEVHVCMDYFISTS